MNSDLKQTIIETKREDLIEILREEKMSVWEAAEFAMQEYVMGIPNGDYNYHEYHDHFTTRYLKNEEGEWKFGTAMTSVMQHLFHKHISKGYTAIKNAIYQHMEDMANSPVEEQLTLKDFDYNMTDMCDYVVYHKMDLLKNVIDIHWNIIKTNPKTKKK